MRASPVGRQGGTAPDAPASEGEVRGLARELVEEAVRRGVTLATAESCTGGLVAGAITAIPGSSGALLGGVVSYAIPVKAAVLGVGTDILDAPGVGAVSSECAAGHVRGGPTRDRLRPRRQRDRHRRPLGARSQASPSERYGSASRAPRARGRSASCSPGGATRSARRPFAVPFASSETISHNFSRGRARGDRTGNAPFGLLGPDARAQCVGTPSESVSMVAFFCWKRLVSSVRPQLTANECSIIIGVSRTRGRAHGKGQPV
jgi:hypothetical protein